MKRPPRLDPLFFFGLAFRALALAAVPACGTQEIGPDTVLRDNNLHPGPNQGSVEIVFAPPAETYADFLAAPNPGSFVLVVDGKMLVDSDGELFTTPAQAEYGAGNYGAGVHHFAITQVGGGTVFAADGQVRSGALTRLYLFGPLHALQGRFVSYPLEADDGTAHISAINLVRSGGVEIEVVICTDATSCKVLSPPLALGDTFDADVLITGLSADQSGPLSAAGVGFGYRQVATPSHPAPPVLPLVEAYSGLWEEPPGAKYVAAPEYMLADGTCASFAD